MYKITPKYDVKPEKWDCKQFRIFVRSNEDQYSISVCTHMFDIEGIGTIRDLEEMSKLPLNWMCLSLVKKIQQVGKFKSFEYTYSVPDGHSMKYKRGELIQEPADMLLVETIVN